MRKITLVGIFLALFFLPLSACSARTSSPAPTPTPTPQAEYDFAKMTTYELFWPVTAGKLPGDKFYDLKVWRDKAVGFLIFGDLRKSEYLKNLANKRLVEAEGLLEINRLSFFPQTLKESYDYFKNGLDLLYAGEEGRQTAWFKDEYRKDTQKHLVVLERMRERVGDKQKSLVEETIQGLRGLAAKYKIEI